MKELWISDCASLYCVHANLDDTLLKGRSLKAGYHVSLSSIFYGFYKPHLYLPNMQFRLNFLGKRSVIFKNEA